MRGQKRELSTFGQRSPGGARTELGTVFSGFRVLRELAASRGVAELWIDERCSRCWAEFGFAMEAAARVCSAAGVGRGSVVVTPGDWRADGLAWLFGVVGLGAIAAPISAARLPELERWKDSVRIDYRIQDGRVRRVGEGTHGPFAAEKIRDLARRGHPGVIVADAAGPEGPAPVDFAQVQAEAAGWAALPGRTLPVVPFDHLAGLDAALRVLAEGGSIASPPEEPHPELVGWAVERRRIEVLPTTAGFLQRLLASEALRVCNLRSLRLVPYTGEELGAAFLERLHEALPTAEFVHRLVPEAASARLAETADAGLEPMAVECP